MKEIYIPDISIIVNGRITQLVETGELEDKKIIVPRIIFAELESRAGMGRDSGFSGLDELRRLKKFSSEGIIDLEFVGDVPSAEEITDSEVRSNIRKLALSHGATLITSDEVMAESAEIEGIAVRHMKPLHEEKKPRLFEFFDPDAMSVHLKVGVRPMAKVGRPGKFDIRKVGEEPLDESDLREISREITELARRDPDGYIEVEKEGASMVQLGEYRIAIARPPFSDALEITAVRPIADVNLEDYELSDELKERLSKRAEGVLVAGPPGAGKSTFAQALAEFYQKRGKIIKTMESPRDLQVDEEVTQYTALEGDMNLTSDILLMVRPDYTIYDELRRSDDFEIFVDMRFAGVGMVGVVHSTQAIDAVQRLIGRVELGMIPMVVDTVVFVEGGEVRDVYALRPTVGVPEGMGSPDLARPMVEVQDFESGEPYYQIYSFGEQVVVMPVKGQEMSEQEKEIAEDVRREVEHRTGADVDVRMLSSQSAIVSASPDDVPRIIGRNGQMVEDLQDTLGVRIDVREREKAGPGEEPTPEIEDQGKNLVIKFGSEYGGKDVKLYAGGSMIFKGSVGSGGEIKIKKNSQIGDQIRKVNERGVPLSAEIV
ncbi:MAG: PINc/VapC family ATPase [Candidatus Hadarchaeia archaeon]